MRGFDLKSLSKDKRVLLLIPDEVDSQKFVLDVFKKFKNIDKICYVTLYKSRNFLVNSFKSKNINLDKFYFVDTVSSYIKEPKPVKNTYFVPAPYDLEGMEKGIISAVELGYSTIIFDSLSALLSYGLFIPAGAGVLTRFVRDVSKVIDEHEGEIIFLSHKKTRRNLLMEETLPIFDRVIEF